VRDVVKIREAREPSQIRTGVGRVDHTRGLLVRVLDANVEARSPAEQAIGGPHPDDRPRAVGDQAKPPRCDLHAAAHDADAAARVPNERPGAVEGSVAICRPRDLHECVAVEGKAIKPRVLERDLPRGVRADQGGSPAPES
jgi:hypothetical protein